MARGVWHARNLALVRGNDPADVERRSAAVLAAVPHPTAPIGELARLAGVGPATAVAAAALPAVYPFFDELVAAQVPGLGAVAWTLRDDDRYAQALRDRAGQLGRDWTPVMVERDWTPVMVERALWAHVGGKAGTSAA
jgi:hypothetical protein